ncbi:MAG: sugar transferase, partial [Gemmatimonadales bacterium]|nr:sugar transferase [Gemmatimonadales bacterium]
IEPSSRPERRKRAAPLRGDSDGHLQVRLGLQQRASSNVRRHLIRAFRRLSVLFLADLAAVGAVDVLLRSARQGGLLGDGVARLLHALFPAGPLANPQYLVALFIGLFMTGSYGTGDQRRSTRRLFGAVWLAALLQVWTAIWIRGLDAGVLQYFVTAAVIWVALRLDRLMVDRVVAWVAPPDAHAARTVFVGPAEDCREAAANPAFRAGGEYSRQGFLDLRSPAATDALGEIGHLPRVLHDAHVETVVVCGYLPDRELQDVVNISLAAGCQLLSVPRSIEVAGVHPSLVWRRGRPLMELTAPKLQGQQLAIKRAVDLVGAVLGLVVLTPLMALIALAVRLDSPGPVLFRQERIGVGGRRFRVWKFRTMVHGASDRSHRDLVARMLAGDEQGTKHTGTDGKDVFKLLNDPRVTRVGALLRRTSLDELPQLVNVLTGDMSLVGPRPPVPYEFEAYDHWQFDRLQVRPGITGLWQVSGRNLLSYRQMCELDVEYVRRWSVGLDLKILFRTIPVVLFNSGRAA